MEKTYDHKSTEKKIYKEWEEGGYFKPEINKNGKPYCIVLPPPNANAPLHFGHAVYTIEDILIRFHRMKGFASLWIPGADHAGFETQFVFEKYLQKQGKSRFDYKREELYQMIWDFVQENRNGMELQLRALGFSLDWTRRKFTLDPEIVKIVYKNFKKLYDDGFLYRAKRLVNYCVHDGTSFSDLEVVYEERESNLFFIKYPMSSGKGFITVATTRPETMLGDTAVAVNPSDPRYKNLIGKKLTLPLVNREIPVVMDETVDMEFGTGAVKITPAHDQNDFERGQKHNLDSITVIGFNGKMTDKAGIYKGLSAKEAREKIIEDLEKNNLLDKTERVKNSVPLCYKCKKIIEPLLMDQWFVKMKPLAEKGIEAVKSGKIRIYPNNFEKIYFQFLENIQDWNISRQIVWGIRIPAWKCNKCDEWIVTDGKNPEKCKCGEEMKQDTDTFDTWFSSAQWPFATLMTGDKEDFEKFYPTSVMETGYDILRWWVARMIMIGLYATGEVSFEDVVLHGLVKDPEGKKMSKSKGNVVNPIDVVEQYSADAVRFALIYGTALGNDQALSYPKFETARKFTNKLWNMGRFIEMKKSEVKNEKSNILNLDELLSFAENKGDKEIVEKVQKLTDEITALLEKYDFNNALQKLYEFIWHEFADVYIEDVKKRIDENSFTVLNSCFLILLKLLHPFMPYVTEELFREMKYQGKMLIIEKWPI